MAHKTNNIFVRNLESWYSIHEYYGAKVTVTYGSADHSSHLGFVPEVDIDHFPKLGE